MKLTMLGTGNAAVTRCYNTCFVLSEGGEHFLVDTGGGNQILGILKETGICLSDIHDIFITHAHIDHLLGLVWIIRMLGQGMNQGLCEGQVRIYCHSGLVNTITTITELTLQKKVLRHMGKNILLIPVRDGETKSILDCRVTFFDIASTKARQFGFSLTTAEGKKLSCCGDEPYNPCEEQYVSGSDWLMHEAFCLAGEAEKFRPYEKHHSTVKDACVLAEKLHVSNLILYHTEDTRLKDRKKLYTQEGSLYYSGKLYVPDDKEVLEL